MIGPEVLKGYIEIPQGVNVFHFHLAPYFLVRKDGQQMLEILRSHGLGPCYDPIRTPLEVEEKLWDEKRVDSQGYFTFPPQKLVLGHTLEDIRVPVNRLLRLRDYFIWRDTEETLPLRTNLGTPLVHPGSLGPQTYEIYNESSHPLTLRISDLVCPADILPLERLPFTLRVREGGNFTVQERGKISLGNFTEF